MQPLPKDFLIQEAHKRGLTGGETEALLARLSCQDGRSTLPSELEVAHDILHITESALRTRFTGIYKKFKTIPKGGPNRFRELYDFLRQKCEQELPKTLPPFPPNNRPYRGICYFVGRETALETLHQKLQAAHRVAITAVVGMGGIGKTELALQYILQYGQVAYPGGICWLDVREQDVGTQIVTFASSQLSLTPPDSLSLKDQVAYCWRNWPAFVSEDAPPAPVLVVLDDVTHYQKLEPYFPIQKRFTLLITTRLNLGASVQSFQIDVLSETAALELLRKLVGTERIEHQLGRAKSLCKWLGYLPLALELVGRYLHRKPDCSLATLQERLNDQKLQARALIKTEEGMTASLGVVSAFELSWQELSEATQTLAMTLSLFAPTLILWTWVEQCWSDWDPEDLEDLRDEELQRLSLIQRIETTTYQLHSLIHRFIRTKLIQYKQQEKLISAFCCVMMIAARQMPQLPIRSEVEAWQVIATHVTEAANQWSRGIRDKDLLVLFQSLKNFYAGQGDYAASETWCSFGLTVLQQRLGNEHADVATWLNNLAELYSIQGHYEKAESLFQKAIDLRQWLFGDIHCAVAYSLHSRASLYSYQGLYKEAESLFLKVLIMRQHLLGDEHPDFAKTLNNLAASYAAQGVYEMAEPLLKQALKIHKKTLDSKHPIVAGTLHNLGNLYQKKNDYDKAEKFLKQALELREELLGDDHLDVAQSLSNLAELYNTCNRYSEAETLLVRALKIYRRLFGEVHRTIANSLYRLAILYSNQGLHNESEVFLQDSLAVYEQLLNKYHPSVAKSLKDLAGLYSTQNRCSEVELFLQEVLELFESDLGQNHLSTQTVRENLQIFQSQN